MQKNYGSVLGEAGVRLKRYEVLADEVAAMIATQLLLPGDRLPSVRQQHARRGVSPSTVFQAYYLLEGAA